MTRVTLATREEAERAVEMAMGAWPRWRSRPLRERAQLLEDLADRLEEDRFELAALQTFEEAKPWEEADADVAEAVDFCRYYARQALNELATRSQTRIPGEANELAYCGRGPTAVIAPWNFPLAILCGMSVAALVAGNTVLMKPSKQSSAVGHGLHTRMLEVGFPEASPQSTGLPEPGSLYQHPETHSLSGPTLRSRSARLRGGCFKSRVLSET